MLPAIIILSVTAVLLFFSLRHIKRHGACDACEQKESCHGACESCKGCNSI